MTGLRQKENLYYLDGKLADRVEVEGKFCVKGMPVDELLERNNIPDETGISFETFNSQTNNPAITVNGQEINFTVDGEVNIFVDDDGKINIYNENATSISFENATSDLIINIQKSNTLLNVT